MLDVAVRDLFLFFSTPPWEAFVSRQTIKDREVLHVCKELAEYGQRASCKPFFFFLSAWGWVVFLQLRAWAWPSRLYGMWELCRDTWSGTYGFGALTSLSSARCLRSLGNWLLNASTWPADLLSPRWAVICCSCLLCPPQVLHVPPPEPLRSPSYCEILSPSSDCLFLSLCQQPHTNVGM